MKTFIIIQPLLIVVFVPENSLGQTKSSADISFERVEIDNNPPKDPWIKITGDINGDQRPDLIVGGQGGPLVWYENPTWRKSLISEGGYDSVVGTIGDIDDDGDLDVILGGLFWYENPGTLNVQLNAPWRTHKIADYRAHDVQAADLDGDGKLDVVVRDQSGFGHNAGNKVVLFRQNSPDDWTRAEISCPYGEGLKLADLDGDDKPDVLIGNRWYRNPGQIENVQWKEYILTRQWDYGDTRVALGDFNGDGRIDVTLSPSEPLGGSYKIAWYKNPKNPLVSVDWKENVVDHPVETVVHSLNVADLDADGAPDIVAASMHQGTAPHEVRVYFNLRSGRLWKKLVISQNGSHETAAIDLDGDAAIDIIGANWSGPYQPVEWWRNNTPTTK